MKSKKLDSRQGLDKQFSNELLNPSIDLSIDYAELFIDDLLSNEALKEIPIVKTIVGTIKIGISINQLWFAKKVLTFIKEFNSGSIDPIKLNEFKYKVNSDIKFRQRLTEQVMVFNERFLDIKKSKISAQLLIAMINGNLTYSEFINLNISLDKIHPDSYIFLQELSETDFEVSQELKGEKNFEAQTLLLSSGLALETSDWSHGLKVTSDGIKIYELGIKNIIN